MFQNFPYRPPGSQIWRERARSAHHTTPAKSAGEGVRQGRLRKPLGIRDPVVAACGEWVPPGDLDGLIAHMDGLGTVPEG